MVDDLFSIQYTNLYINQNNSLSKSDDVVDISPLQFFLKSLLQGSQRGRKGSFAII